jgi:cephalosporin-C deacetylase
VFFITLESKIMPFFDMPRYQLQDYLPDRNEPTDFDGFWHTTLSEARAHPLDAQFVEEDYGLQLVETYDVTFNGYAGQPIKGWLVLPRQRQGPLPCVVEYIGYSGGRGFGFEHLLWANAGYAHFIMDTRGQGSSQRKGDTPDMPVDGANPSVAGFMTQGILNPYTYYYRRVFTDAARAVEAARSNPAIDSGRIAVAGGSQGGGITLAAAALVPDVPVMMADVPFLCHYRRAVSIVDTAPYNEITRFLVSHREHIDTVFRTLSYFDGVNFAPRINARALFSVGLMDMVCPPSTVYAAYNYLGGPKEIAVYEFNQHEGGGAHHTREKLEFMREAWGNDA